ncbi:hypothetical protein BS47DRAFT_130514 [Hydnum rufescens UP504]|uniref:Uncharacterized protein n=1 Tax=Hydnum rufescens UP504 TaxID=1448309 RepID=A0A9P6DSQ4_9AGAM|nr:hypothetical protein BS47DRAFT_130514 [Hydnum rufescens UP504]
MELWMFNTVLSLLAHPDGCDPASVARMISSNFFCPHVLFRHRLLNWHELEIYGLMRECMHCEKSKLNLRTAKQTVSLVNPPIRSRGICPSYIKSKTPIGPSRLPYPILYITCGCRDNTWIICGICRRNRIQIGTILADALFAKEL